MKMREGPVGRVAGSAIPPKRKRWEYSCVRFQAMTGHFQDFLCNMGLEGWELIHDGRPGECIFKREAQ